MSLHSLSSSYSLFSRMSAEGLGEPVLTREEKANSHNGMAVGSSVSRSGVDVGTGTSVSVGICVGLVVSVLVGNSILVGAGVFVDLGAIDGGVGVSWDVPHATKDSKTNVKVIKCGKNLSWTIMSSLGYRFDPDVDFGLHQPPNEVVSCGLVAQQLIDLYGLIP
jgi:hypothetical protein